MIDYSQSYPADHRAVVNNSSYSESATIVKIVKILWKNQTLSFFPWSESETMIIPHFLDSAAYNNLHLSLSALSQSSLSPLSILSKLSLSLSQLS